MTKIKKVVAMALAFLMIFSSASVLANAWTVTVDDGFNLAIGTKFFINEGTEDAPSWVETEKVAPGDSVKARVYIGTDYYSNSSTLLFFYDKDFFTHSYIQGQNTLSVNTEAGSFAAENGFYGKMTVDPVLTSQVNAGYIDSAFLDEYAAISVNLLMGSGSNNVMYDDSTWIFEFDLKVADTATGEGDLFVKDTTVQNSTSQNKALVNVPKGPEDGTNADVWPMWRWNANVSLSSQPVSTLGSVTFDANGGSFADGNDEVVVSGDIKDAVTVPAAPTKAGYTFIGWVDATDTTPTYEEAQATVPVATIPYDAVAYNAYWIKNVNITFDTDGGSEIAPHEDVTPYTEFAAVINPTKDGYTFVGWDERGNMTLPETYPDVDTTYTAIWALNVTVSFDTDGAAEIESIDGVAGEDFEAVIANPSKEGHRFVKWSPALPTVFPTADTTYKAVFETIDYPVYYYVEGKLVSNTQVEYGAVIPTTVSTVAAPEGMTLTDWYTDKEMTEKFVEGTVMGTEKVYLYAEYEYATYNAIFDANGGTFADGNTTVSIPTVYLDDIVAPATAPTKVGYEFAGWTPYEVGAFDEANDMYFYATWKEVNSNVKYYADGNLYEVYELATGEEFEVPADPYKEGYSFLYWAETEGGAEVQLPATMPELEEGSTIEYYAVFEINEYTITWDVDGETTTATYEYDELIEAVADPEKDGYTFAGWDGYTDGMKMPAKDVTATATWTIETYTLKFDTDGGNEIGDIIVEYNEDITAKIPADPTKEGHTFAGWSENIPTVVPDLGDNGAEKTFTATWTVDNFTITWIVDGEEDVDTYAYGADVTAPTPTKEGYVFAGWDGEVPATMPAENLTFTGSWNPATDTKYTVNIHTMDVDGNYVTETDVLEGTTEETVKAVYTVEEGFELNAKSVTEGEVKADGTLVLDVYLDRKTVTISFNSDGGSDVAAISGLYGAAVEAPADPTKTGYKFENWSPALADTFPAADVTLTAVWSAKTFDATFNANGGQLADGSAEVKVPTVFGEAIEAPADPTMKGYKFEGWTPAVGTMDEEGKTFTAVWSAKTFNATFDANGGQFADGTATATVETVFGEKIEAPAAPTKAGYVFSTWSPSVGNMTEEGMSFTAQWVNATDTKYTVTINTMNTAGEYEADTATYGGETGALVKAEYTIEEGFKLSETETSVLEGNILADGSLALVVYIDRIAYDVSTDVDGEVNVVDSVLYGAAVAKPAEPSKVGYTFAGWDGYTDGMTMPAEAVTLTATWTANANTAYKVIVNYTDAQTGEAVEEENNFTGTTAYAIKIAEAEGSEANTEYVLIGDLLPSKHYQLDTSAANELEGTVAADGSTVLNVYLIPVKYTATFDTDGGAFADGLTTYEVELDYYSLVGDHAPAEVPTKEGHTFAGWRNADTTHIAADRTFYAIWEIESYTLKFETDGGNTIADITQEYNTTIVVPADPTKEGHTFAGWSEKIPTVMPDLGDNGAEKTFTATWTVDNFTITWIVDGEEDVDTYAYGADVTAPTPTKEGYVFAGWDGEVPATMPAENLTFTGSWNPATDTKYTVNIHTMDVDGNYVTETDVLEGTTEETVKAVYTVEEGFELNAKSVTEGEVKADGTLVLDVYLDRKTVTISFNTDGGTAVTELSGLYGATVGTPEETTKTGYTFDGWSPEVPETFPAADTSVTAQWTINSYDITFNAGEGTFADGSKEKTIKVDYNVTPVAPETPSKVGYGFTAWSPELAPVTGNATYTAQYAAGAVNYTVNTYTMGTDGKYGEPVAETKGGTADTLATVTPVEKTGFTVAPESVLEGTIAADGSLVLSVYYARNQYDFTVNVDGTKTTTQYYYEAAIATPETPVKEGHTFAGWNPAVPATMPAENTEVAATWTVDNFTITWIVDGEEDVDTYAYGADVTAPTPTKEGYVFAGWDGEVPATMPAENLTFTGSWNPATDTKYTVNIHTMDVDGNYVTETDVLEGTTEETVKAVYTVEEGFELNAKSVTEGEVKADGTLVLDVYLDRKTATITFNTNGGSEVAAISGLYGAAVEAPADPTKEGYEFAGWDATIPTTIPAADVTINANWTLLSYTLNYRYNGIYATFEVPFGTEAAAMPAPESDPTRTGYTFAGWSELPATMPANTVDITASWEIESYTIKFDTDGGSEVADITADYNAAITVPAAPTKAGYIFNGWVDAEGNSVTLTNKMADLGDNGAVVTYKATWANDTHTAYTVEIYTMNAEGTYEATTTTKYGETGTTANAEYTVEEGFELSTKNESVTSGTIAADGTLVLKVYLDRKSYALNVTVDGKTTTTEVLYGAAINVEDPSKEGYDFTGWSPALPATMPAEGVDVTATWKVQQYTVTWIVDGKETVETLDYGAAITAPKPTKDGYVFAGWDNTVPSTMPAENLTFTGSWVNATDTKYTVTIYTMNTDGTYAEDTKTYTGETGALVKADYTIETGFELSTKNESVTEGNILADSSLALVVYIDRIESAFTVDVDGKETTTNYLYGASIATPETPVKEGYTFAGWDPAVPATMPETAVTVKATWTVNAHTITWIVDGVEDVDDYNYGDAVSAPTPTKEGYVFAGWDGEVPATMPAENLTFTGSWNPATDTKYTVNIHTMDVDGNYVTETDVLEGTTEETVKAVYTVEEGFELNAKSVTEGEVKADGTLVLDVYLDRKTVTITFANTGDSNTAAITGLYGAAVEAPADPTWVGYTFDGWDATIPTTIPAADVTITATWKTNSYTVTWVVDGTTTAIDGYDYGAAITAPADPAKAGYTFAGWAWTNEAGEAVAESATMPAYNVTATATWTANDGVAYKVEIYKMAIGGETYELADTKNLSDKAGAEVTYAPETLEGFTYNEGMSTVEGTVAGDGSLVLKVYYDRNTVNITINGVEDEYYYGEEIPVPTAPTAPEGYEQDPENPWVDENGDPVELPITVGTDNPAEIKPNWKVLSFDITWTVDGVDDVDTYEYNAAITAPEVPAKEGYRFVGWADATGAIAAVPATMPANDLAFTAIYETNTYTVNYYVDGVLVETLSGEYGNAIATSIASYKVPVGYELGDWYTDAAYENKLADGATIAAATTNLYAETTAKSYEAIFMVDGEVYDTVSTAFDAEIVAPEDPTKDGYVFAGWTPTVGIMDEEGKTFEATWKEGDYTVTYKADGMADEVFGHVFGEEIDVPADPYKEGYTFKHWSLTEGGEEATIPATMPAENLVYYAVFEINEYTVTWVIDGAETVETYEFGAAISAPEAKKDNYSFIGWSLTADGEIVTPATEMGTENLKYYAVFEAVTYTVTWVIDGAETVETLAIGAAITAPNAVKDGFEFKGWSLTDGGELVTPETVMGEENLKYYAVFEEAVAELPIKLMPSEDYTGVIERYGEIESHNDGSADPELVYETEDFEEYYVYGFTGRRFREDDVYDYFYVQGNGYMELEYSELSDDYGTGAKIIVKDNDTDEVVEEFYVIIFGDLDGDASITNDDASAFNIEVLSPTWSHRRTGTPYMIKAADLDLDGRANNDDAVLLNYVPLKSMTIDQTTGEAY